MLKEIKKENRFICIGILVASLLWCGWASADILKTRPEVPLVLPTSVNVELTDLQASTYYVVGPEADTLYVDSYLEIVDHLIVMGEGVVILEGAELRLHGSLWQQDNGKVIIGDGGYLHVMQVYLSQYPHYMYDNAYFEATDAIVYANTTYRSFLYDNSTYIARRTHFPFWNFRECYDMSTLILEDANMVGDLLVNDSCRVQMTGCDTVLPWFEAGEEVVMEVQFPDYEFIEHFMFDSTYPGVVGVKYRATFDSCGILFPGIELKSGGSVSVNNSVFCLALRLSGTHTIHLSNVKNKTLYSFLEFPFVDRFLQFENSYLALWCVYTFDQATLSMDSCFWGEAHARDSSYISAVNCSTTGFPSSVTSVDKGRFDFKDGKVTAFVSSWFEATTYLENAVITPVRPGIAQTTNIAHQSSRLLCVNCEFDSLPFAMDTAMVIFATFEVPDTAEAGDRVTLLGSAWLSPGPFNPATLDYYAIHWSDPSVGGWTYITEDSIEVRNDTLGIWNTTGMEEGSYILRLWLSSSEDDSMVAYQSIWIRDVGVEEIQAKPVDFSLDVYPNPFNSSVTFDIGSQDIFIGISIFSLTGKLVAEWSNLEGFIISRGGLSKTQSTFRWEPSSKLASGIFLVRFRISAGLEFSQPIIYLK